MSRGTGPLPDGWDEPIPEGIWADALIAAVRTDVGALGSARVLDTLRRWRIQARTAPDAQLRAEAAARLREVGDALAHVGELAARPKARIASVATPAGQLMTADEVLLRGEEITGEHGEATSEPKDRSLPPRQFADEDEHPTMLRAVEEQLPKRPQLYRAARVDPFVEYDEKPTASIDLPGGLQALQHRAPTEAPAVQIPQDDTNKLPSRLLPALERKLEARALDGWGEARTHEGRAEARTHEGRTHEGRAHEGRVEPPVIDAELEALALEERTAALVDPLARTLEPPLPAALASPPLPTLPPPLPPPPSAAPGASASLLPPPVPLDDELSESKPSSFGLAPKPGVVRRSAGVRRASPARPRAAMQQVRALHAAVLPLCEELIPLNVERRSRRFWARWREVAGDRGVRREFVESLLVSAKDVRTLVCELIAEVQTVDVRSVYALVDKLESSQTAERPTGARPGATPDRQRGPLVGAQVRVEGVSLDDRDD